MIGVLTMSSAASARNWIHSGARIYSLSGKMRAKKRKTTRPTARTMRGPVVGAGGREHVCHAATASSAGPERSLGAVVGRGLLVGAEDPVARVRVGHAQGEEAPRRTATLMMSYTVAPLAARSGSCESVVRRRCSGCQGP